MNDKIKIELSEDEDLIRAKAWWKENGTSIIAGIVIGTVAVIGYNYWGSYKEAQTQEVAQLYESYLAAPEKSESLPALLEVDAGSVYAQLARLSAAKNALEAKDYTQAESLLDDVIASHSDAGISDLASLRLATVFLAQEKADDALAAVEKFKNTSDASMQARVAEVQADAQLLKGDRALAKTLYERSIAAYKEAQESAGLAQLKLDNL